MKRSDKTLRALAVMCVAAGAVGALYGEDAPSRPRRHVTPVENETTGTMPVNETREDTARINAAIRARSSHYHRDDGAIVYIDTVTGDEWIDSTAIASLPRMKYPLFSGVSVSVDIWDPLLRLFGQKYGLTGFSADVNLHNRYFPTFEAGLGTADNAPSDKDFHYRSPLSVFFKIGANYNFLYNSNPAYKFFAGVRYGFSPFKWGLTEATPSGGYWGSAPAFTIPYQNATAGWLEFGLGLRVKLWSCISAGWMVKYHVLVHESTSVYGEPWYIPGYGSRNQAITGSFMITYTLGE